jgi:Ser-tRNA(Ala) deacylase AlaX
MNPTVLTYLEHYRLLTAEAIVVELLEEEGRGIVMLDQTIFYPQGGGQPYDQGTIEHASAKFLVEEVRFVDGIVKHIGRFEDRRFDVGQTVTCKVNSERRQLHSRIHSVGHLVDMAVRQLQLNWIPGKGFHFPDGPYVEYTGSLEGMDREKLKADIEHACLQFIQEDLPTEARFIEKEHLQTICAFVPENIPEGKPSRVILFGDFGVPCGGTHVRSLGEIQSMTIRKIKPEGGKIRVGYQVSAT